jgi:hypothetical protein
VKPDPARIDQLERELGISSPVPLAHLPGYVMLIDSEGREASERVPVSFTVGVQNNRIQIGLFDGPITLTPTRFGMVRAVGVLEGDEEHFPACHPDLPQEVRSGYTFTIQP